MCDNQVVGTGELSIKAVNIKIKKDKNRRSGKNKHRRGIVQANAEKILHNFLHVHWHTHKIKGSFLQSPRVWLMCRLREEYMGSSKKEGNSKR